MGESENSSVIQRTLKNLCLSTGSCYGVFWGFDNRNPMLLTPEEAYYEDKLGLPINNLLLKFHLLGEGTVGQAALNGKHLWILSDECDFEWNSFMSSESKDSSFKLDSELHNQFSSGIKTIVVIPVGNRGVVQFGSTEKICERLEFVDQTIRLFRDIQNLNVHNPFGSMNVYEKVECDDINAMFASLISSQHSNNKIIPISGGNFSEMSGNGSSVINCNQLSASTSGVHFGKTVLLNNPTLGLDSRFFQDSSDAILPKVINVQEHNPFASLYGGGSLSEAEKYLQAVSGNHSADHLSLPSIFEGLLDDFKSDEFGPDLFDLCQVDDFSQWFSSPPDESIDHNMVNALSGELTQLVESASTSCAVEGNRGIKGPTSSVNEKSTVTHCTKEDTSRDQKPKAECGQVGESWEDIVMPLASSAMMKCGPRKGLFSELGLEELLAGTNSSSCLTSSNLEDHQWPTKRRRVESGCSSGNTNLSNNILTKKELPKSQVGLWIGDSYSIAATSSVLSSQPKKPLEEHKKVVRKRARPGESTRPRPKDRQLIQDRIKELRGIIPNCGKCSIDSLLERTIKYMVFLQGVTKHGDKLKHPNKPKLIGNENDVSIRDKNDVSGGGGGGATWAYEVGGQSMVCPIIVEDLSTPGQMLIEMLCEDQGFFLEIADIIRGLGLSILKGVIEVRDDKIWAHFIVEAKSHITRIDVFWSLVRLLQQTNTNTIDTDNIPSNAIAPMIESYQKPNLPPPPPI